MANTQASSALHYLWLDVTRQAQFWEGLGVGRGDAPTAVAISLKKRRQAQLDSGAFTETGLKAFVDKLIGGRSITNPLQVWAENCRCTCASEGMSAMLAEMSSTQGT